MILPTGTINTAQPALTPTSRPGLSVKAGIGIGVSIPLALVIASAFLVVWIRRYRKTKRARQSQGNPTVPHVDQPYLQHKAELEADERLFELDAHEVKHEAEDTGIHEISTSVSTHPTPLDRYEMRENVRRQEMRAEEHSQELA